MPTRLYYAGRFTLDVDDVTGERFWRGHGGLDDKDETRFDPGQPLILATASWPAGTVISAEEPRDVDD